MADDLRHAQVGVRAVAERHRPRRAAELLHRHHVVQVAQAQAAVLFGDRHPVQPARAHLAPQVNVAGERVACINLRGARRHQALCEVAHALAELFDAHLRGAGSKGAYRAASARAASADRAGRTSSACVLRARVKAPACVLAQAVSSARAEQPASRRGSMTAVARRCRALRGRGTAGLLCRVQTLLACASERVGAR